MMDVPGESRQLARAFSPRSRRKSGEGRKNNTSNIGNKGGENHDMQYQSINRAIRAEVLLTEMKKDRRSRRTAARRPPGDGCDPGIEHNKDVGILRVLITKVTV